jgi:NADH dehydrogenase
MKIAISGASGFIGGELVRFLSKQYPVVALRRNLSGSSNANVEEHKFDLNDETTFSTINDAAVFVHCAFIKYDRKNPEAFKVNIDSCLRLAELCKVQNKHFIFLSTMSAHTDAKSQYGKHKFEIEKLLSHYNCTILRLGLVMGNTGGLFHNIQQTILKAAFVPLIDGGIQPIQVIHVNDLCKLIQQIAEKKTAGSYNIGTPKVYTLKYLYEQAALAKGKQVRFVFAPYFLVKHILSVVETFGINAPVTTENLLGLKQLKAFDTKSDLDKLGISLMSLEEAVKVL